MIEAVGTQVSATVQEACRPWLQAEEHSAPRVLPPRSTAGQLTLDQHIGVRIPGGQPKTPSQQNCKTPAGSRGRRAVLFESCAFHPSDSIFSSRCQATSDPDRVEAGETVPAYPAPRGGESRLG